MSDLSDKGLDYWNQMVKLLFDQFDEKSGKVRDIKIFKPSELDYVEYGERIADIWFKDEALEHPQSVINLHDDGWFSVTEVFDFLKENLPEDFEIEYETLLSYDTNGFTGSVTSYYYFRVNEQAILAETADEFTPGMYVIKPVTKSTELTNLILTYFLREGLPSVDVSSLDLNPNWIDQQEFKNSLVNRLTDALDDEAKSRWLISHIKETLDSSTDDRLIDIMGATDLTRLRESLELNKLNRGDLELFINALLTH